MHAILAAQSTFSIGTSIIDVEGLVDAAKAVDAKAVALTDTMSVTGMIDFTDKAKKADIQPILGCRLRLVDDPTWRKKHGEKTKRPPEYYLTCYVLAESGLKTLFGLLSLANSADYFYNNAKIGFADLFRELEAAPKDGLAFATGDAQSILMHPDAPSLLDSLERAVGASNVYLTLNPIDTPYWDALNRKALEMVPAGYAPLVTRPCWYEADSADAAQIMAAVTSNAKVGSLWAPAPAMRDLRPMTVRELTQASIDAATRLKDRFGITNAGEVFRAGLKNTEQLAARASYVWSKQPISLPKMAPDEFVAVVDLCKKGWSQRFGEQTFGHKPTEDELKTVYRPRLAYELSVLRKLGFSGYFLLVHDIVEFAKSNGILVGPGRGSVGGSLAAYLMGITDVDPIRFNLLFERFINPDRIDLPDIDLDFMSERRGEVIDYLIKKYGTDRVAGISNFNSLAAASTIRDVGKAFGLSDDDIRCSKYVEKAHGQNIELVKQLDKVPEIATFKEKFGPIWDICVKIEGSIKSMGRHAAGVVVGGCDLVERGVIEHRKDGATINWDKRTVEDQGLVKVDILGLETLDLIDLTCKYIRERHSKAVDLMRISLEDAKVLENFALGKTVGIFQYESGGMRRLLKELGKDGVITFDDITAANALYRPGPMDSGMMDSYWKRKQGLEAIEYDHPVLKDNLKDTYGVAVYQEQIMQMARDVAGYSMPDADKLRKIMGKKLPEEMAKERGKFVNGCVSTVGMPADDAGELFDKVEKFAGYGFNKSHSAAYALIAYQSMWLKTNFPVEFYAAALSLMKDEKLPALLKDANGFGITVNLPDVNISTERFEIVNDTTLCIPFSRIKGLSTNAAKSIVEARGSTLFADFEDFQNRITKRLVNKAKVEILDKIGAFARLIPGQLPAKHPDRIRDQLEFIPGLISASVPISREMFTDKATKLHVINVVKDYKATHADDGVHVQPTFGKNARFMVITDAPTSGEEKSGQMSYSDSFSYIAEALSEAELSRSDAYWTALIKRPKEGKQVSASEVATYLPYLEREIDLMKPPVIVLMGSATVRSFFPDFKGKASDAAGKVIYSEKYDANVVIGFNSGEIFFDPDKQIPLNEVFAVASNLLN